MNILDNINNTLEGMFGEVANLQTTNLPKDLNIPIVNRYDSQKDNCLDMMNKMLIQQKQISSAIEKKKQAEKEIQKKQEELLKEKAQATKESSRTQGQTVTATEQVAKGSQKKDLFSQWKQITDNVDKEIKKFGKSIEQGVSNLNTTIKDMTDKYDKAVKQTLSKLNITADDIGHANNFGAVSTKKQTYTTIIPKRDDDPRFYMSKENFHISHPILEVEFLGEYGKLHASPELPMEKLEEGQLDGDIVSLTIDRRMGQDAPSFNITLVWRDSWYYQLASNDLVKIKLKRPSEPLYRNPTIYEPLIPSKEPSKESQTDDTNALISDTTLTGEKVPTEGTDSLGNDSRYLGPDYNKITEKDSEIVVKAKKSAQEKWIASNVIKTQKAVDVQASVSDKTKESNTDNAVTKDTVMGGTDTEEKKQDTITTGSNKEFQYDELGNIIGYNGLQDNIILATDDILVANAKQLAQKKIMTSSTEQPTTVKADETSSSTVKDNDMQSPEVKNDTTSDTYSEENANIIFVGMIDDIRKDLDWSSGNPRRVVTISGRGICKAMLQFDMDSLERFGARNYLLNMSRVEKLLSPLYNDNTMLSTYATARAMPSEAILTLLKIYARKNGKYDPVESTANDEEETDVGELKSKWRVEQMTAQVTEAEKNKLKGEKIWDPTKYSFLDYKYGSKVLPLQELFDFRYEDYRSLKVNVGFTQNLGNNTQLAQTNTGCIWNMLKSLANLPFNELYWESYFGKEQLILRNTPFTETLWNKLPCTYIPDSEVLSDTSGRSDYETYTCFVTDQPVTGGTANLRSVAPPCFNPALLGKYGLRTKVVNSPFIFRPIRDEIKDVQLNLNGKMIRNGNTYENVSEELYNKLENTNGYHRALEGVRITKASADAVAQGRTQELDSLSNPNKVQDNDNQGTSSNPDIYDEVNDNASTTVNNDNTSNETAKEETSILNKPIRELVDIDVDEISKRYLGVPAPKFDDIKKKYFR